MELLLLLALPYLLFYLLPVKLVRARRSFERFGPPEGYVYAFVFHVHTQFSYDSLGKPEDVYRALEEEGLDFAVVTDHETDAFKYFADGRVLVGVERKINDEKGRVLGDLIKTPRLSVITHHFKKYPWRLERKPEHYFELINLKDALVERRLRLFLYLLLAPFVFPVDRRGYLEGFTKLLEPERYARAFVKEGWENRILGGLDHHTKLYVREVGIRFLFPSYRFSFSLLRNVLLTDRKLGSAEELEEELLRREPVVCFTRRPVLCWREGDKVKVYSPYEKTLVRLVGEREESWEGPNLELEAGRYLIVGYRYAFKLGPLFFGVRPLFLCRGNLS
ncbi:MAG: hypothetical protein GXO03_03790 [Aquificae bacterium]|nr:hypothetical protein [Aquificota bacterium]